MKINYYGLSLSELSFIVLTNTSNSDVTNDAYNEIKRRFSRNGCNYGMFMEYEEEAVKKRGNSIAEYIINPHVNSQKLMEVYFNYVYKGGISIHGNLLFSELLLCNNNCKNVFFINFIKNEIQKIKTRIASNNLAQGDIEILQFISDALNERLSKTIPFYDENDIIDAVSDISCTSPYFLSTEKQQEKFEKKYNDDSKKMSIIKMIPMALGDMILGNDGIDLFAMECFAQCDSARLTRQKRSILKCNNEIDYSFVDRSKVLNLKNSKLIYFKNNSN